MTIQEFVDGYEKAQNKENFVKKHIINDYVDYEKKMVISQNIVNSSCYIKNEEQVRYVRNSNFMHVLFLKTIIGLYTDIEMNSDGFTDFNMLNKCGVIDMIIGCMSEREYVEFSNVLENVYKDDYENNRGMQSYVDGKISALMTIISSINNNDVVDKNE